MDKKVYFIAHGDTEKVFLTKTFDHYLYNDKRSTAVPYETLTPEPKLNISSTQVQNLEENTRKSMMYNCELFDEDIISIFVIMIDINEEGQNKQLQEKLINTDHLRENVIIPTLLKIFGCDINEEQVFVKVLYCDEGIENALSIDVRKSKEAGKSKYMYKFIKGISNDLNISGNDNCDKIRSFLNECSEKSNLHELYYFYDEVIES